MKMEGNSGRIFALALCPSHLKEAGMNALRINLCVVAFLTVVLCCGVAANAQSVTVSPGNLSFGVPTGSTVSAAEAVNFSVSGTGNTLTVTSIAITPNNAATGANDFAQTNTCSTTISAPGSCSFSVTFTPTLSNGAGVLESATLNITYTTSMSGNATASVPLTGALGAIRLFDPVYEANSNVNATLSSLVTFDSTTLTLSCPASPTAVVSSSPDGSGYVLVDNFMTLVTGLNPTTQTNASNLVGNVCPGNLGNPSDAGQPDCFTSAYQGPASGNDLDGLDPDTFTNPGNTNPFLTGAPGGVPPINVSELLAALGSQGQATFSLLDGGGKVTSTTLFLVTSCSLTNATSGSETGNPTNLQPSQTLSFDTVVNHLDQYAFNYSLVPANASITNPDATPVVTNISIPPGTYTTMVADTPFANTSCIPLASLGGNCALKTQVCAPPLPSTAPAAGIYCPQTSAPDFLFTSTFDPVTPISNPNSTFGFLEFNDAGSCPLEGPEANSSCPQNGLVSFSGPGSNSGGRGAGSTNSSVILVANVTPPTTTVVVSPFYSTGPASGWTNGSPTVTFTGNPAAQTSYVAPISFIEYGVNPTSEGLPPTFPIPFAGNSTFSADTTFTAASCPSTIPALPIPPSFGPESATLGPYTDGYAYLLHYSTTDCAATHELLFTYNGSWSTSFKSLALTTDALPPAISITAPAASTAYPAYQKVKAAYACTDTESGVASCSGTLPVNSYIDSTPTNGLSTPKSFTVNAVDNVGNAAPLTVNYSVSCNYAAVGISPSTVTRPALVGITASVIDCMSAPQNVKVQFSVSGPIGRNCSNASSVLLTTPPFTIKSGASNSISFPFPIGKNACAGTYTVTTTTLQGSTTIDIVNSTLTVH